MNDDGEMIACCEFMRDLAEKDDNYEKRCIKGEKVFVVDDVMARIPGHIYSEMGKKEFSISGCCEYHFDEMFAESTAEVALQALLDKAATARGYRQVAVVELPEPPREEGPL
jgi:hypothetical protein